MENKIATSVEQSEKLIELGIDKNTSDMYYEPHSLEDYYCPIPLIGKYSSMHSQFPAWSLSALLELLPNDTIYRPMLYKGANKNNDLPCWSLAALLEIIPKRIKEDNIFRIDVGVKDSSIWYDGLSYGVNSSLPDITADNLVDACYYMIIRLHELNLL